MITNVFGESLSPGNEQREFWGSATADAPGGANLIGIKDPVIDELIDLVIMAPDRQSLVTRTRALDRVLLWGHYVIPSWHLKDLSRCLLGQVRTAVDDAEAGLRHGLRQLVDRS